MNEGQRALPLCVALEGTVIRNGILAEGLVALLSRQPWLLPLVLLWWVRGRSHLQHQLAQRVPIEPASYPYRAQVVEFLQAEHAAGRTLVLATAVDAAHAEKIAAHLGFFDFVIASNATVSLIGQRKAEELRRRFGERGFDYLTGTTGDLPALQLAHAAITVDMPQDLRARIAQNTPVVHSIDAPNPGKLRSYLYCLRPHQWLKNALIFLPAIAAHRILESAVLWQALLAFAAFSCAASAGYIVNDVLDLPSDRRHPRKHRRPFAAAAIPISGGATLFLGLLGLALVAGLALGRGFMLLLLLYLVATVTYSSWLKRKAIVDVLALAGLYTLRILAGSAATHIPPSFWLLALAMFFFMDLACVKRFVELSSLNLEDTKPVPGRGYSAIDRETIFSTGSTCGLISVLVLALYINGPTIADLYPHPQFLWGLCPLLLYWTGRIWILARRGLVHDDPLVFAVKDQISILTFACCALLLWLGSNQNHFGVQLF